MSAATSVSIIMGSFLQATRSNVLILFCLLVCVTGWSTNSIGIPNAITSSKMTRSNQRVDISMSQEQPSNFFFSQKSLESIGLSKKMVSMLEGLQITKPSKIQALSFTTIKSGKHVILGDQTGSGKTLAYLLPILQRMDELLNEGKLQRSPERAPYIVIMTPTTELAEQVASVIRFISNVLKFRSSCFTSSSDFDAEQKKLRLGVEVLVTTPGRLLELIKRKEISMENVQTVVLDEVDVLFQDTSFPLPPIGQACPPTAQFIFTSATLPQAVLTQITREFQNVEILTGPGLHRISPTIEEVLVDCSGPSSQSRTLDSVRVNKFIAMKKALETVISERTLIFCNTIDNCRLVENTLQRQYRKQRVILPYHGAVDADKREENLAAFAKPLLKEPHVLICTDRASRGMDFDRSFVDHVILWDFPREPSEYLRRVGRTGRAGRPGRVTVFAYGKQVEAAKAVIRASIEGKKIEPDSVRNDSSFNGVNEEEDDQSSRRSSFTSKNSSSRNSADRGSTRKIPPKSKSPSK